MTPNALNRRSMLTGGTLISLGTLLTACAPHDTTPTGGAATASGAATTNSSSSSSAGNNAGSGEYRKADERGPAQNVPKPNAPEDGYREKTAAGIRKTMDAWNQWINYGIQTGDYSKAREFLSSTNDGELKIYREIEALYRPRLYAQKPHVFRKATKEVASRNTCGFSRKRVKTSGHKNRGEA